MTVLLAQTHSNWFEAIDIYHDLVTQTQDTFLLVLYVLLGSSIGILTGTVASKII